LKNGRPVTASATLKLRSDGNRHRLVIRNVTDADAGNYVCTLSSDAGMKSCQVTLSITGKTGLFVTVVIGFANKDF